MAKISGEAKKRYSDRVKAYKQETETIVHREKNLLETIRGDGSSSQYKRLKLVDERLNLASYFLLLNRLSVGLLGVKNEAFLNDGRKSCYQAVIYLEEVVSNRLDAPFSDYSEYLEKIEDLDDEKRYRMVAKLGFTIQSVEEDFGENSKWKWSFVELEGRYAVVTKNLLNLKTLVAGLDPRVEGYQARLNHLNLAKELLQRSADRYREKYELSTLRIDDFKLAIAFLAALRRIHTVVGETQNADTVKKKMDVWKTKMETDERNARTAKA
ncbi:MAG: hypothetical protein GVY23_05045 [Spirochaetes bacterium]|jgi:hypothetical protein|nr:hypothetical protein [Spirochaetota bacterium]